MGCRRRDWALPQAPLLPSPVRWPLLPQLLSSDMGAPSSPSPWGTSHQCCWQTLNTPWRAPASRTSLSCSHSREIPQSSWKAQDPSEDTAMGLPSTRILSQPHCLEVLGGGQPLAGSVLSLSPSPGRPTILRSGAPFFGNSPRHWTKGTVLMWLLRRQQLLSPLCTDAAGDCGLWPFSKLRISWEGP